MSRIWRSLKLSRHLVHARGLALLEEDPRRGAVVLPAPDAVVVLEVLEPAQARLELFRRVPELVAEPLGLLAQHRVHERLALLRGLLDPQPQLGLEHWEFVRPGGG